MIQAAMKNALQFFNPHRHPKWCQSSAVDNIAEWGFGIMGGVQMIKVSSKFDKKEWQCYEQVRCDMIVFITGAVPDSCPGHPCPTIPHRYAGLPMPLIKITSKPHTLAIPLGKLEVIWALRNLDSTRGRAVRAAPASLDLDRSWCGAALARYRM
jgi:hypothetical protein